MFGLHERSLIYGCIFFYNIQIKISKGDKTKIRTHKYIQLNTEAKEIKQLNPGVPSTHGLTIRKQTSETEISSLNESSTGNPSKYKIPYLLHHYNALAFCNATFDWIASKECDSISCDILSEIV